MYIYYIFFVCTNLHADKHSHINTRTSAHMILYMHVTYVCTYVCTHIQCVYRRQINSHSLEQTPPNIGCDLFLFYFLFKHILGSHTRPSHRSVLPLLVGGQAVVFEDRGSTNHQLLMNLRCEGTLGGDAL